MELMKALALILYLEILAISVFSMVLVDKMEE